MRETMIFLLVATPSLTAGARAGPPGVILAQAESPKGRGATIRLESAAFKEGGTIPKAHTSDGRGTFPRWPGPGSRRRPARWP